MNTAFSDKKVKEWKAQGPKYLRGNITFSQKFEATPNVVFPMLCPTTEYDWMEGWHCEMIYSKSLYHEYNAIFKTDYFGFPETWVVSSFEPNKAIEFVRVAEHLSIKIEARIADHQDGTCTGSWTIYATALTTEGNEILKQMNPEEDPISILIDALAHYLKTDEMKPLPEGIFNKK